MQDQLNTKDLILRKHWKLDSDNFYVLCQLHVLETRDHLFFECPFAMQCWEESNIDWNMSLHLSDRCVTAKQSFNGPCFMEVLACATWNIWKEGNEFIFQNQTPSFGR
jgi:hypothetical protein